MTVQGWSDEQSEEPLNEMLVENPTIALELLAKDAHPMQQYRELTENAKQAILATPARRGVILWDVDWLAVAEHGVYRLACIDNGEGMSGQDQVRYINTLFVSGREQGTDKNFGIGAKITAGAKNPNGVVYMSWRDGAGSMVHFRRRDGENGPSYGLVRFDDEFGKWRPWVVLPKSVRPAEIRDHGTLVILMGSHDKDDTILPPQGSPASGLKWLSKYLNQRYFEFPAGVTVRVREFPADRKAWPKQRPASESEGSSTRRREISGMGPYLKRVSEARGEVLLPDGAVARWWILRDGISSDVYLARGHTAALYQSELHDVVEMNQHRMRMQGFGVLYASRRVVLYVEPSGEVRATTARDSLRIEGRPLPWETWATAFKAKMPPQLEALDKAIRDAASDEDHSKSIRERLKQYRELFAISAWRPRTNAPVTATGETPSGGDARGGRRGSAVGRGGDGRAGAANAGDRGTARRDYRSMIANDGVPAEPVSPARDIPTIEWLRFSETEHPADRAAIYVAQANTISANSEFRVFTDMIDRLADETGATEAEDLDVVRQAVREWYGQVLVEAVVRSWNFENDQMWPEKEYQALTSPEGLTAAVLPFTFLLGRLNSVVGSAFAGRSRGAASRQ